MFNFSVQDVQDQTVRLSNWTAVYRDLNFVKNATDELNSELKKLSYHHHSQEIILDTGSLDPLYYIDNLNLSAKSGDKLLAIGGDGRNNQILMALWKLRGQKEYDPDSEHIFYCIEEPEAHLHPHQQRKLADYLFSIFPGQIIVTSHSPEIVSRYRPDSIVRLYFQNNSTKVASNGCSDCIDQAWQNFGYRMSIISAESFFASAVFLVEGPSEKLLYRALSKHLDIDLDFYNISIISVDGFDFDPYIKILDAMEIPWVLRTDNDFFKVPKKDEFRLAGLERVKKIISHRHTIPDIPRFSSREYNKEVMKLRDRIATISEKYNIFISFKDLENDFLSSNLFSELQTSTGYSDKEELIEYMQTRKAIRMNDFLIMHNESLNKLVTDPIAKPLKRLKQMIT